MYSAMVKPSPILDDMPWFIKQKIVAYAGPIAKLALRKCSRELQKYADASETRYSSTNFTLHKKMVELEIQAWQFEPAADEYRKECISIEYHFHPLGCLIRNGTEETLIDQEDYMERAAKDFTSLFRSPRSEVTRLHFNMETAQDDASGWQEVQKAALLKSIHTSMTGYEHQLRVRTLKIHFALTVNEMTKLFGVILPGSLEEMAIRIADGHQEIQQLMDTEHWKQAKQLSWEAQSSPSFTEMTHFRGVTLQSAAVTLEDLRVMIQTAVSHGRDFNGIVVERALLVNWQDIDDHFIAHLDFEDDEVTSYRIKVHDSGCVIAVDLYNEKVVIGMEDDEDM